MKNYHSSILSDGSSKVFRFGVGILLQSPKGEQIDQVVQLDFSFSNNKS